MAKSKIEWTDMTINPIVGCTKVSPGCQNCYAERMAKRLKAMGKPQYQTVINECGWTGQVAFHRPALEQIRKAPAGKKIFIGSMGDIFHENVPFDILDRCFRQFAWVRNQKKTIILLTKRPQRMLEYYEHLKRDGAVFMPGTNLETRSKIPEEYLHHIWLGVTAENQEQADKRIPILLQVPAAVKFVSIEPMLGEIDVKDYLRCQGCGYSRKDMYIHWDHHLCKNPTPILDWVIVGCESGPKRRPCKLEWIESIVDQCKEAGVPCFVKQVEIDGRVSHDMSEWPEGCQERSFPEC